MCSGATGMSRFRTSHRANSVNTTFPGTEPHSWGPVKQRNLRLQTTGPQPPIGLAAGHFLAAGQPSQAHPGPDVDQGEPQGRPSPAPAPSATLARRPRRRPPRQVRPDHRQRPRRPSRPSHSSTPARAWSKGVATGISAVRPRHTHGVTWAHSEILWRLAQHPAQRPPKHVGATPRVCLLEGLWAPFLLVGGVLGV